jgi:ABC-2 type transport system permease protein
MFMMVAGLCSVIWSLTYLRALVEFASALQMSQFRGQPASMNINYQLFLQHISMAHIVFIFIIPAITMRLISEEKRLRTYDLLLTSPVTATEIAVGKYFGGLLAVLVLVLLSFLYPLATGLLAEFSWSTLLTAYLGLIIVSGLYVAVGVFASSLTESLMLSLILGLLFNLTLWFVGAAQESVDNSMLAAFFEHITIGQQFFNFLKGTIRLSSAVFFLSAIVFFVFLSQRVVESSRWR